MDNYLAIALAGAIGCLARFSLSQIIYKVFGQGFPYGTLTVNLLGCLLIGILATLFLERINLPPIWRSAALIGFLGGFTTFSSFTLDTINLLETGNYLKAVMYVIFSVGLGLLATIAGVIMVRGLV